MLRASIKEPEIVVHHQAGVEVEQMAPVLGSGLRWLDLGWVGPVLAWAGLGRDYTWAGLGSNLAKSG
ncbi:hypothetical protein AAC387_Pa09g1214 [Persea americana]